jgi:hypothetical protein
MYYSAEVLRQCREARLVTTAKMVCIFLRTKSIMCQPIRTLQRPSVSLTCFSSVWKPLNCCQTWRLSQSILGSRRHSPVFMPWLQAVGGYQFNIFEGWTICKSANTHVADICGWNGPIAVSCGVMILPNLWEAIWEMVTK